MPTEHLYYEIPTAAFVGAALAAVLAVVCLFRARLLIEKNGVARTVLYIAFLIALSGFLLWHGNRLPNKSVSKIAFNSMGMSCGPWVAPWSAIVGVEFEGSLLPPLVQPFLRGGDRLVVKFDPAIVDTLDLTDYVKSQRAVICPLDGLDAPSDKIYADIRGAWDFAKAQ